MRMQASSLKYQLLYAAMHISSALSNDACMQSLIAVERSIEWTPFDTRESRRRRDGIDRQAETFLIARRRFCLLTQTAS